MRKSTGNRIGGRKSFVMTNVKNTCLC